MRRHPRKGHTPCSTLSPRAARLALNPRPWFRFMSLASTFAALRQCHGWQTLQVTLDDATRITADQVMELSLYLQQATPEVFRQVADLVADQPLAVGGLSAVLLLQLLRHPYRR